MKKCHYCSQNIDDYAIVCPYCGANQYESERQYQRRENNNRGFIDHEGSKLYFVLGFIFPPLGAILWYLWRYSRPEKSGQLIKGATAGISVSSPIVGFAIWFFMRDSYHYSKLSKIAGVSAVIGLIVSAILGVLLTYLALINPEIADILRSIGYM